MKVGLFPGQGIPARTVLESLPERDPLVENAQEVLGYPLHRKVAIAARRKNATLPTVIAQPAIYIAGVRALNAAREEGTDDFEIYAGHSLGEYAALTAAGAFSFEDGLRVVSVRAEAMEAASRANPGSMAALIGLDTDAAEELARRVGAAVANDNSYDQVVLAGTRDQLSEAAQLATANGARSVLLEVSGPFHTDAMAPAKKPLAEALEYITIDEPSVPVVSNVTARPYESAKQIRELLVDQVTSPVRWRETIVYLNSAGVREFIDLGPGRVVGALAQRTLRSMKEEVPVGA